MSFIAEIKRRNVFRVAIAYAATSWLLIQLVTTVEEPLGLPPWFDTSIIVCLAVGLPVAVVLAWAFELTPEGIKPTESVERQASITPRTGRKLTHITIGVLAIAVALLLIDRLVLDSPDDIMPNSLAVLPLENLSPDRGDAYFAPGLHEEILNRLAKLQNLTVIARTTMNQYADSERTIPEIADELKVAAVMEGSVRFADNRIRVTAQLIDPSTGGHLWSDTYEREFDDIFAIETDIAMNVANAMAVEFSVGEQQRLEEIPTSSVEAYRLALSSRVQLALLTPEGASLAIDQIDEAVRLDPLSPFLWTRKAVAYAVATVSYPQRRDEYFSEAENAANHALQIDASYGDAYTPLSMLANNRGNWLLKEEFARKALDLGGTSNDLVDAAFDFQTGDIRDALRLIETMLESDPLNATAWFWLIHGQDSLGETGASLDAYEAGKRLFANWYFGHMNALVTYLGAGDTEQASRLLRDDLTVPHGERFSSWINAPGSAAGEIDQLFRDASADPFFIALFAAYFGDNELALRAMRGSSERDPTRILYIWRPVFSGVRQLGDFKDFMRDFGAVAYWQRYGWPDVCRPLPADNFVCD